MKKQFVWMGFLILTAPLFAFGVEFPKSFDSGFVLTDRIPIEKDQFFMSAGVTRSRNLMAVNLFNFKSGLSEVWIVDLNSRKTTVQIKRSRGLEYYGGHAELDLGSAFSPDERYLYIRYSEGDGEIVDVATGARVLSIPRRRLNFSWNPGRYFDWSPDGLSFYIVSDEDSRWHRYDLVSGAEVGSGPVWFEPSGKVQADIFSVTSVPGVLRVRTQSREYSLVDENTQRVLHVLALPENILEAADGPNRDRLVLQTSYRTWFIDLDQQGVAPRFKVLGTSLAGRFTIGTMDIAWSPDGSKVAVSGGVPNTTVVDVFQFKPLALLDRLYSGAKLGDSALSWSTNDKLADSRMDRWVVEWDLDSRTQTWSESRTKVIFGDSNPVLPTRSPDTWVMLDTFGTRSVQFLDRKAMSSIPKIECGSDRVFLEVIAFLDLAGVTDEHKMAKFRLQPGGRGEGYFNNSVFANPLIWSFDAQTLTLKIDIAPEALTPRASEKGRLIGQLSPTDPGISSGKVTDMSTGSEGTWNGVVHGYSGINPAASAPDVLNALAACP